MAQGSQRQDEPRKGDPEVARAARHFGAGQDRPVRLAVPVPPLVRAVLERTGKDPSVEMHRVIGAFFRKLTPERGPETKGPYAGEVRYFERLNDSPSEVLTAPEEGFVLLNRAHEAFLEVLATKVSSEDVRRELEELAAGLAELVDAAQEIARTDRGEDTAQFEWEITEP